MSPLFLFASPPPHVTPNFLRHVTTAAFTPLIPSRLFDCHHHHHHHPLAFIRMILSPFFVVPELNSPPLIPLCQFDFEEENILTQKQALLGLLLQQHYDVLRTWTL